MPFNSKFILSKPYLSKCCYLLSFKEIGVKLDKSKVMLRIDVEPLHYGPGRLSHTRPQEAQSNLKSSSPFHDFHVAMFSVLFPVITAG